MKTILFRCATCAVRRGIVLSALLGVTACIPRFQAAPTPTTPQMVEREAGARVVRVVTRDRRLVFVRRPKLLGDTLFGDGYGDHRDQRYALAVGQITEIAIVPTDWRMTVLVSLGLLGLLVAAWEIGRTLSLSVF